DYGARLAMEMGADVVKLNLPKIDPAKDKDAPAPYNDMDISQEDAVRQVVESAGRSLVVLSGGSKIDDDHLLRQTRFIMEAGVSDVVSVRRRLWPLGSRATIGKTSMSKRLTAPPVGSGRAEACV